MSACPDHDQPTLALDEMKRPWSEHELSLRTTPVNTVPSKLDATGCARISRESPFTSKTDPSQEKPAPYVQLLEPRGHRDSDGEDFEEKPVLPGFVDPITQLQVEEPALSPYGHVMGYETWCMILRTEGMKDTCPFTRQSLKRRQLVKLTHENIEEHRHKILKHSY